jgi:hypothetical protein
MNISTTLHSEYPKKIDYCEDLKIYGKMLFFIDSVVTEWEVACGGVLCELTNPLPPPFHHTNTKMLPQRHDVLPDSLTRIYLQKSSKIDTL